MSAAILRSVYRWIPTYDDYRGPHAIQVKASLVYWPDLDQYMVETPYACLDGRKDMTDDQIAAALGPRRSEDELTAERHAMGDHRHFNSEEAKALRAYILKGLEYDVMTNVLYKLACKCGHYLLPVRQWSTGAERVPKQYRQAIASL